MPSSRLRPLSLLAVVALAIATASCGPVAIGAAAGSVGGGGSSTSPPSIALLSPSGPVLADRNLTLTYVTSPRGTACEYQVDGGAVTAAPTDGTISITVADDGPHDFVIRFVANPDVQATYSWVVDTVAPGAPGALAASSGPAHRLDATWTAAIDPAPASGIASYELAFEVDGAAIATAAPVGTAATLTGLPAARQGRLRLRAVDRAGNRSPAVVLAARTDVGGDGTFAPPVARATGLAGVRQAATGDFNRDRILDVVVLHGDPAAPTLVCLLGNGSSGRGDGTFTAAAGGSAVPAGARLAVADLDADRRPDVVAAGAGQALVLRGDGDGTFTAGATIALAAAATAVTIADLDDDNIADLAIATAVGVQRFRGNAAAPGLGNATFTAAGSDATPGVTGIATALADNDRNVDLVLAGPAGLAVAFGAGGGSFGTPVARLAATVPNAAKLVLADVNGDGLADPVVVAGDGSRVQLAWSDSAANCANGEFTLRAEYTVPGVIRDIAIADVDTDGISDLLVLAEASGATQLNVLRGLRGANRGLFATAPTAFACGAGGNGVVLADFDARGTLDVLATDGAAGDVLLLRGVGGLGRGDGTFQDGGGLTFPGAVRDVATGDFNRDGIVDLGIVTQEPDAGVFVAFGNGAEGVGNGTFATPIALSTTQWFRPSILAEDMNGDRLVDLVTSDLDFIPYQPSNAPLSYTTFLANTDGTFQAGASTSVGFKVVDCASRLRRGRADLACVGFEFGLVGNVRVMRDTSVTACSASPELALQTDFALRQSGSQSFLKSVTSGDFNRDGRPDLVVIGAREVNAIGANDVGRAYVIAGPASGGVATAAFQTVTPIELPTGFLPEDATAGDFDDDGFLDLFLCNTGFQLPPLQSSVSVIFGNGNGTFDTASPWFSTAANRPNCFATADYDGDGIGDIAVGLNTGTQVRVFRGNGAAGGRATPFTAASSTSVPDFTGAYGLATADVNSDGIADLLVVGTAENVVNGRIAVLLGRGAYPLPLP